VSSLIIKSLRAKKSAGSMSFLGHPLCALADIFCDLFIPSGAILRTDSVLGLYFLEAITQAEKQESLLMVRDA
jgi:hypothetical protein